MSQYLTPCEVAEILHISVRTVYRLMRTGKLRAVKVGHSWRVPESAVLALAK